MTLRTREEEVAAWWRAVRDPLSFMLGSAIVVYEVVVAHADQKLVLGVAAALLGIPVAAWTGRKVDTKKVGDGE